MDKYPSEYGDSDEELYDKELDRIVDTQNVSYDQAKKMIGRPRPSSVAQQAQRSPHAEASLIYGPFGEQATQELDRIDQAKYKSELNGTLVRIARLAMHDVSPYEADALSAALKNKKDGLTYRAPEPIAERREVR